MLVSEHPETQAASPHQRLLGKRDSKSTKNRFSYTSSAGLYAKVI
jgi:hypothetical protein